MTQILLPDRNGSMRPLTMSAPAALQTCAAAPTSRSVYAAAHVVADPLRAASDGAPDQIDWDATLRLRHEIWALGLGVAEAMDTAQRGAGLSWEDAARLTERTLAEARQVGGRVVVGAATDQLSEPRPSLPRIRDAYAEQIATIEGYGGDTVMMASRQLAAVATSAEDYLGLYDAVLGGATRPVVLHWLGEAFDPALAGYWGHRDPADALETVLEVIGTHPGRVRGIKTSVLDPGLEIELRRRVPAGVRVFTGDDFNYVDLIAGDGDRHSDALLGAFAAVPRFASAAFARLDAGDPAGFRRILNPTEGLSRLIFEAPTRFYKVGVAWLAYLDGRQDHFKMINGFETGRSLLHLADLTRAADAIGLFNNPDLAAHRATRYFAGQGIC